MFPENGGLYLVRGINEVEPSLGANGAGKSSMWDAVSWALYGKTARGVSGPAVESWLTKGHKAVVEVEFNINGTNHIITRTRGPIQTLLDGKEVKQDVIDDLLGLNYDRFLQVALMGQFGTMFTDMKPAERLSLLDGVLDLETWTKANKAAAAKYKSAQADTSKAKEFVDNLRGVIDTHKSHIGTLETQALQEEEVKQSKLVGLRNSLKRLREEEDILQTDLAEVENDIKTADAGITNKMDALNKLEPTFDHLKSRYLEHQADSDDYEREYKRLKKELDHRKTLDPECPHCYQSIDASHKDSLVEEAKEDYETALASYNHSHEEYQRLKKNASDLLDQINQVKDDLDSDDKYKSKLIRERDKLKFSIDSMVDKTIDLKKQIKEVEQSTSTAADLIKSTKYTLAKDTEKFDAKEAEYYDFVTQEDLLKPWPQRFKELKLWVVEQALDEFAIHVNTSLVELGLTGWSISFITKREGASRGALEIVVTSPNSHQKVPWEAWSGGETQRLRVACAVGLAELIRSRLANPPMFEAWDEPTAHLDPDGVADLIAFFSARSDTRDIWMIDHRSMGSGAFDGSLTVVKTTTGSVFREGRVA